MNGDPIGAWDAHHGVLDEVHLYGCQDSYLAAARWVEGCVPVEDWGCGGGGLRQHIDPAAYIGVDGSASPFADRIEDLRTYRTESEGIVLRHVLEHNYDWRPVLDNAIASFTKRLAIVIFTLPQTETRVLQVEEDYGGVPVIGFAQTDITGPLVEANVSHRVDWIISRPSVYGMEWAVLARRDD